MRAPIAPKNEVLQIALQCAERGWLVFPCHNENKRPLTEHGLKDATRDAEMITWWFTRWPGALVGLTCGRESGIFVVDCDVDPAEGLDGVAAFKELFPDLPETITVKTPRGGRHYYFKYPNEGTEIRNSAGKLAPSIDVRGEGGYVIAAGSRRSDGVYYEALADVCPGPPPAPRQLIDLFAGKTETDTAAPARPTPAPADAELAAFAKAAAAHRRSGNGAGYGGAALDAEAARVAGAPRGQRNHTLNRAAFSLGQLVAAGVLHEGEVRLRLRDAAIACGLVKDDGPGAVTATLNSGLAAGMKQPRRPPEKPTPKVSVADQSAQPAPPPQPGPSSSPSPPPRLPFVNIGAWVTNPVPEREWVVRDRIPANNVTLLSGEGSVGKSILSLHLAVAIVLARDWASTMPEVGPALVVACEDDADELHRRLDAVVKHYGASFADLTDLHLVSLAGHDALLATPDRSGLMVPTKLFQRVTEAVRDIRPRIVILDNSADVFGGSENDRAQVRQFIGMLRGLAMVANAGVLLTSHPSLTGISSGTGLSGSTAWNASVRSRLYLKRATTAKDEEPDPNLRVLEVMKNNYGPVGETITLRWKDGLFAPVAAGVGSLEKLAREQKTDEMFLMLLDRCIAQGRGVNDKKASHTYAPTHFVDEPEAKTNHVAKRELAEAMERLLRAGKIHVVPYGYPSRGWTRLERK